MEDKEKIKSLEKQIELLEKIIGLQEYMQPYIPYTPYIPYIPYEPYRTPNPTPWQPNITWCMYS